MKYTYFLIISSILIISSCNEQQNGYRINAEIEGLEDGTAVLKRRIDGEFITVDSAEIAHQSFSFSGVNESPELNYIYINDTLPYIRLFVENSDILISGHVDSLRTPEISGSELNALLDEYNKLMQPYEDKLRTIYQQYSKATIANDTAKINAFEAEFDLVADQQKEASLGFVSRNADNVIGPYLVWGTLAYDLNIEELENIAGKFSPEIAGSVYVKQINDYVATLKEVDVGQPYTNIVLPDPEGNMKKLSDLEGKIILIDFWASWCGPCRRENPNVVKLYQDYKDKGFEIFGVSLDENRDRWIKAITDDNLTWEHVSDLKGWNSEAGRLYGVRAIPHTVLIDKNGIIIDKNLRGNDLRERIKELVQG